MTLGSLHRRQLRPWHAIIALAMIGCGGADRGRPEAVDDGVPGPDIEDLGSGPFRCDQDEGLEFGFIDDFEGRTAHGNFYTNNDVCELCQALIDLRVGGYATGASLDRTDAAVITLLEDLENDTAREDLRVQLRRLVVVFQTGLEDPAFILHHGPAEAYQQRLEELVASDLDGTDVLAVAALVNTSTEDDRLASRHPLAGSPELLSFGEIQLYVQDQTPTCRAACEVTQTPTPVFAKPVPAAAIPGGRCGSHYAINIKAGPLFDWGGSLGASFGPPIDGTEWEGISFWARVGTGSRTPMRIEVSDRHTDEKFENPDNDLKPICNPDKTEDTVRTGCDKFGLNFQVSHDWKLYTIPFDELRQKGWGMRAPYFDIAGIRGMSLQFERGEWDIWVDDIALYRREP